MKKLDTKTMNISQNNNMCKERLSNMELLRIIAMFMIIVYHFFRHGILKSGIEISNIPTTIWVLSLGIWGKIGVSIFILISGYFLINSALKLKKWLNIYLKTIFYSILAFIIVCILGIENFHKHEILNSILISKQYWFIKTYLILYLFVPYINKLLHTINKNEHIKLLILMFSIWSIIPAIFPKALYCYSNFIWFVFLYTTGAFIQKYKIKIPIIYPSILLFVCLIALFVKIILLIQVSPINLNKGLIPINNLFEFGISLAIFCIFKEIKINSNKIINYISASTFSVYLIHDNIHLRKVLWHKLIDIHSVINHNNFIAETLIICLIVFILCTVIDKLLEYIYKPAINQIITTGERLLHRTVKSS